ncbi:MAG: hypothetical protein FIA99_10420 [Ruminiclostridium sp.]|nr:hypothetical protein [Ruminiclostridium sp.]
MNEILDFVLQHRLLTALLLFASVFPAVYLAEKLELVSQNRLIEALGSRIINRSIYNKCAYLVSKTVKDYERRDKKVGFYLKAKVKMKKAGYYGEYAAVIYLLVKYVMASLLFLTALLYNYPDIFRPVMLAVLLMVTVELVVGNEKRKINLKFQKYIYKIYKYLHNQISSGVKVTDAVKTVYEVIEDKQLRSVLIRLAAGYELTLDIDGALEDFRCNFDINEAETLCVALKQGIETGDNQELLARQEEVMFKKYFNYIQAETDSCKTRSLLAVVMFTAIVAIMIIVPLFNDVTEGVGKIFIN